MTLCQVSAAGCQSPRDLVRGYRGDEPDFWHEDGVEVLAERLREAVVRGRHEAAGRVEADPAFAHLSRAVALPKRLVSYEAFRRAEAEVARLEAICDSARAYRDFCAEIRANEAVPGRPGPYDSKLHHFVLIRNAEAVVNRYREQFAAPEIEFELHALRLGESVFVTNPFELYLEYGQRIRARSRARRTFVTQLANGSFGYLPTRRAEQLGGYGGLVINGRVGSDGGRKLVDETLAAIAELFPASKPRVTPGSTRARRRGRAR
jgi:hypothetical protein